MLKRILNGNTLIYATIFTLLGLFVARNVMDIGVPASAILLVAVLPAFFATPAQMLAMAISFISLGSGFQYKFALMAYVLIGIIRFGSRMHFSRLTLPLIMLVLWEMLHVLVWPLDLNELMRGFAEFVFLWFVTCLNLKEVDMKLLTRALAIATVGVCCITMYMQTTLVMGDVTEVMQQGETYRFGGGQVEEGENFGLNFNPNQLGLICNLAIAAVLVLMRMKKSSVFDLIMLCACVVFGCFTLSRIFLVCLSFLLLGVVMLSSGRLQQRISRLIMLSLLVGGVVVAINLLLPDVIENFMLRFEADDITNNRSFLFGFYNDHITSTANYCFFGIGLQDMGEKLTQLYGPTIEVCHHGIQEIWLAWGFVGVLMMGVWLWQMVVESKNWNPRRSYYSIMPFLMLLLYIQTGQLISSGTALMALVLAFAVMCIPSAEFDSVKQR